MMNLTEHVLTELAHSTHDLEARAFDALLSILDDQQRDVFHRWAGIQWARRFALDRSQWPQMTPTQVLGELVEAVQMARALVDAPREAGALLVYVDGLSLDAAEGGGGDIPPTL